MKPATAAVGVVFVSIAGLILTTLQCMSAATAEETVVSSPWSELNWTFDGQAYAYGQALNRTSNSLLNPNNAFANLPNTIMTGELRPNARASSTYLDLVLQPRLTSVFEAGGVIERESVRGYFQQGYARLKPTEDLTVTVGRELLTWGPAFFRSPSNPYYFNNARLNPIVELSGLDVARVAYSLTPNLSVTGGVVFDSGQNLVAGNPYRDSIVTKLDFHTTTYMGGLVAASLRSRQVFLGGYAQETLNDAVLLYQEIGSSSSNSALNILPAGGNTVFSPDVSTHRTATALVGGSYTFLNGQSIYAEYLYNGFGYSGSQLHQFFRQAGAAGVQQALGGSLGAVGTRDVGYAATRSTDLLGQHYLYLQYQNNPTQGSTLWRVMGSQNLVDHSSQLSMYLEQNVSDRVSLFLLGVANVGSRGTEFGGVFQQSLTIGLKAFLF